MRSLKDQLATAGLVSEKELKEAQAGETLEEVAAEMTRRKDAKAKYIGTLEDLRLIATVRKFRHTARILLMERPEDIDDVIRLAHRLKNQDGGKLLVKQVISLRNILRGTTGGKRDQLLNRAFRAHGATTEAPVASKK